MSDLFRVHKLNASGMVRAKSLANEFLDLLNYIQTCAGGESRELSICRTKLEEACFYAKKAMAQNPVNQEVSDG